MELCTVEAGLLRKKPCGHAAVAKCENCERGLCSEHALAQVSKSGNHTGKFLCKECDEARRDYEKRASMTPAKPPAATRPPAAPAPQKAGPPPEKDSGTIDFTPAKKPEDNK
ncbi:MAG: hypothetical protein ABR570_17750 [Burkholderiales bacterium]